MLQLSTVSASTATDSVAVAPPFRCTLRIGGTHAAWVDVSGELDLATSPRLAEAFQRAQLYARLVVLDMREVSFIDCSGVHVLLAAATEVEWGGARLMVVSSRVVDRMLALTGTCDRISTIDLTPSEPGQVDPHQMVAQWST
jgi:anti-anti-sigma factor